MFHGFHVAAGRGRGGPLAPVSPLPRHGVLRPEKGQGDRQVQGEPPSACGVCPLVVGSECASCACVHRHAPTSLPMTIWGGGLTQGCSSLGDSYPVPMAPCAYQNLSESPELCRDRACICVRASHSACLVPCLRPTCGPHCERILPAPLAVSSSPALHRAPPPFLSLIQGLPDSSLTYTPLQGYCYVNYSTPEAAAAAVAQLNGSEFPPFTGHKIKVGGEVAMRELGGGWSCWSVLGSTGYHIKRATCVHVPSPPPLASPTTGACISTHQRSVHLS